MKSQSRCAANDLIFRTRTRILSPLAAITVASLLGHAQGASPVQSGTATVNEASKILKAGGNGISTLAPGVVPSPGNTNLSPGTAPIAPPVSASTPASVPSGVANAPAAVPSVDSSSPQSIESLEKLLKKLKGESGSSSAAADPMPTSVLVGQNVGSQWKDGSKVLLTEIGNTYLLTEPVHTASGSMPNYSKYPSAVGSNTGAFTVDMVQEYNTLSKRLPLRSWMGWFTWANGVPPQGINPGIFTDSEASYGTYTGSTTTYFNFQWQKATGRDTGDWRPIRLDQPPLYLSPLNISYNWAPGLFGYKSAPLSAFPINVFYWKDKKIVRGVNISGDFPFFYQYGNKLGDPIPVEWRQSWMYTATRPLESTVVVPGNLTPIQLTATTSSAPWNGGDPFPYPVWSSTVTPQNQTPYTLLVDRVGDWDADLVWEATNPSAPNYSQDRYKRTAFKDPGQGNYLKMTVAQGSPFVWCEMNNAKYANFYNLIRTNLTGHINNTGGSGTNAAQQEQNGTNAQIILDGPYKVEGVQNVSYVLLYGDHVNPNQWYQEGLPWYADIGDGDTNSQDPGGFNPPPGPYLPGPTPTPSPSPAPTPLPSIIAKGQHNHVYTAIYFRTDQVKPVQLAKIGGKSNGTDAQGNPYFFLEFNGTGKNWFVIGQVPEMRYYHTGVSQDKDADRLKAAKAWAGEMGQYAFNFLTSTKVTYSVTNMYQATTQFGLTVANPYQSLLSSPRNSSAMTSPGKTVMALKPHQYQPITLGPDLTKSAKPQVKWQTLAPKYGEDFPASKIAMSIPNANKSTPNTPSRWGYWGLRGNLKAIVTSGFQTTYPFQNFLPVMPPPNYKKQFTQTGIPAVLVTNTGTGYHKITEPPKVEIKDLRTGTLATGTNATAKALVDENTGQIMQIDVISKGTGWPDGNPAEEVEVKIDDPLIPGGTRARAYAQCGGGQVLAIFMLDKGSLYTPVITAKQTGTNYIDTPIIVPNFNNDGTMAGGLANVIEGGAGFNFSGSIDVKMFGTGTNGEVALIAPGNIIDIHPTEGGISDGGRYPASGTLPPQLHVLITPPSGTNSGTMAQTGTATMKQIPEDFVAAVAIQGKYSEKPSAHFVDSTGTSVPCQLDYSGPGDGRVLNVYKDNNTHPVLTGPADIVFTGGGTVTTQAVAKVYPVYTIDKVVPTPPLVGGYQADVEVSFTGSNFTDISAVKMPELSFSIPTPSGTLGTTNITLVNSGSGLPIDTLTFEVAGGRGFDAVLLPIVNSAGEIVTVRLLRNGSNYLPQGNVFAYAEDNNRASGINAAFTVTSSNGVITAVNVTNKGTGYTSSAVVKLASRLPVDINDHPDPVYSDNPKGLPARFNCIIQSGTVNRIDPATPPPGPARTPMTYIGGTEYKATVTSVAAQLWWTSNTPFARFTSPARGFIARVAPEKTLVEQVLYSSIIAQYTTLTGKNVAPFGGAYFGKSAPDGYGLGGQLGGASKFVGDIYSMQQAFPQYPPSTPSDYAVNAARTPVDQFEFPFLQEASPFVSLSLALKGSVYAMQRSLSALFLDPPSQNHPTTLEEATTWQMEYYSQYDPGVGRVVINPTATQPAWGVSSSVQNPGDIPNTAGNNQGKTGLSQWKKGMLWSGFGVSDQWNDQHYFYGYYLSSAALAGLFDQAWQPSITAKPAESTLWAGSMQMGPSFDQLLMTLAYDPDTPDLRDPNKGYYTVPNSGFKYQKFAFFDQWSGHPWATGAMPGSTVAVLDFAGDKFGYWRSFGTDSDKYNGENENSAFEGLQAWSAAILWGGATDRKAIVNLGMYLYSNGLAATDAYFLDKNYNLTTTPDNEYSWAPVSTINSGTVRKNGNNVWPENTGFAESNPEAFYIAPEAFGDSKGNKSSPGQSLVKKAENTLNNFFYSYPTGSKFIQAYPPTPWTMGMVRNSNFMKKWAGAMMREEWKKARESALYQPADWNGMALTAALSGVPYNPGDVPFNMTGTTPRTPFVDKFTPRLWSSWVTFNDRPGNKASLTPPFLATSVLTFLLSLEEYGSPDWTYIAKATNVKGVADNNSVVFTAAFTKLVDKDGNDGKDFAQTTFVAFNPGWTTRYARFFRLNLDGSIAAAAASDNLPVAPKKTVVKTIRFAVKN